MTYLQFHLVFILPPLLLLGWAQPQPLAGLGGRRPWAFLAALAAIAFLYTTPWDNYLVYRGIWGYGTERVLGTIGYVPLEEYLFFLLQPVLTGLFFFRVQARWVQRRGRVGGLPMQAAGGAVGPRAAGALAWLALAALGAYLLTRPDGQYMGLILAWAAPVLAGQWALAGAYLWRQRGLLLAGIALPTLYLWLADRIAIGLGIWTIAETTTLGPHLFGLPLEEATFFLLTNVLVVQGLMLFLPVPGARVPVPEERAPVLAEVRG